MRPTARGFDLALESARPPAHLAHSCGLHDTNPERSSTLKKQSIEHVAPQSPTVRIGASGARRHGGNERGLASHPCHVRKFSAGEPPDRIAHPKFIQ